MADIFSFKQFQVRQDNCAMKVGTDGVLLGAWTGLEHSPETILDIGAGTGLIALMLAQRSPKTSIIDAVEIDVAAYEECVTNFENSPWNDRLFCYHASLSEFATEMDEKYDLIISNPPFYTENVPSGNLQRDMARSTTSLSFEALLKNVSLLLTDNGFFNVIVPYKAEPSFIKTAFNFGLFPNKILHVKGSPSSPIKRSLMAFSFIEKEASISEMAIEIERHRYTQEYSALTNSFYLKM
ncbi:tRNA1(Val) (adenine(37)-N6)-methyltransferase [Leptobacterium sp. I13]|uniref:tRNA1(Val) (adenine(37)-N6)-methyltransferase n=1 Tax=Leptobacterium meishanense TaxID=3128904 RepID=UPI0030EB5F44